MKLATYLPLLTISLCLAQSLDRVEIERMTHAEIYDAIHKQAGQRVNPDSFTHGSSADREKWTKTGYSTGDPKACNTFGN